MVDVFAMCIWMASPCIGIPLVLASSTFPTCPVWLLILQGKKIIIRFKYKAQIRHQAFNLKTGNVVQATQRLNPRPRVNTPDLDQTYKDNNGIVWSHGCLISIIEIAKHTPRPEGISQSGIFMLPPVQLIHMCPQGHFAGVPGGLIQMPFLGIP